MDYPTRRLSLSPDAHKTHRHAHVRQHWHSDLTYLSNLSRGPNKKKGKSISSDRDANQNMQRRSIDFTQIFSRTRVRPLPADGRQRERRYGTGRHPQLTTPN